MTITTAERAWLDNLWRQAERDANAVSINALIMLGLAKPAPPFPFEPKS